MRRFGRRRRKASPKPKIEFVTWTLRLPKLLDSDLSRMAKQQSRSKTKQVVHLLREAIASERTRRVYSGRRYRCEVVEGLKPIFR